MEEFTPEAAEAVELCKEWARKVRAAIPCRVYLFGSAIYEGGDQFDSQLSDLDIVVLFDDDLDATQRAARLVELRNFKMALELDMIPRLGRGQCTEPGVSILPVTTFEVMANIHKGKSRQFFDRNVFYDLDAGEETLGLPKAGSISVSEDVGQALEYSQEVRNKFLAVSANGTGGIPVYRGTDPLPKGLSRAAAQLVPDTTIGSWYDTRLGLDHLFDVLGKRKGESSELRNLRRTVSIRRGGRGTRSPLTDSDQLLAAEILYDEAVAVPFEETVVWEIRFSGGARSVLDQFRLLKALRALIPDAIILGVRFGSVIITIRSSTRSFGTAERLSELGMLEKYFECESVELKSIEEGEQHSGFTGHSLLDDLITHIERWSPQASDEPKLSEMSLTVQLEEWLWQTMEQAHLLISREAPVGRTERGYRADLLVQSFKVPAEGVATIDQNVAVEVAILRNRQIFFRQIERIERLRLPTILVLIGAPSKLASLKRDIDGLAAANASVRVVTVPMEHDDL